jgi:hypothetical protein
VVELDVGSAERPGILLELLECGLLHGEPQVSSFPTVLFQLMQPRFHHQFESDVESYYRRMDT